eukprot:1151985-Pelagomonas_calceolata.AAC.10
MCAAAFTRRLPSVRWEGARLVMILVSLHACAFAFKSEGKYEAKKNSPYIKQGKRHSGSKGP